MDQSRDWAKDCAAGIGARVALYRDRLKISAQELADRCAALGMPSISRIVITKLENGRRETVTTAELQVLSRALGVSAVVLLTGLSTSEYVEILPGLKVEPYTAVRWLGGEAANPDGSGPPERAGRSENDPTSLYGLHAHLLEVWQVERGERDRIMAEAKTPAQKRAAAKTVDVMLAVGDAPHLRTIRSTMRTLGYVLPKIPADIARALGEEDPDGSR